MIGRVKLFTSLENIASTTRCRVTNDPLPCNQSTATRSRAPISDRLHASPAAWLLLGLGLAFGGRRLLAHDRSLLFCHGLLTHRRGLGRALDPCLHRDLTERAANHLSGRREECFGAADLLFFACGQFRVLFQRPV